jgi:hypothetical protein
VLAAYALMYLAGGRAHFRHRAGDAGKARFDGKLGQRVGALGRARKPAARLRIQLPAKAVGGSATFAAAVLSSFDRCAGVHRSLGTVTATRAARGDSAAEDIAVRVRPGRVTDLRLRKWKRCRPIGAALASFDPSSSSSADASSGGTRASPAPAQRQASYTRSVVDRRPVERTGAQLSIGPGKLVVTAESFQRASRVSAWYLGSVRR